MILNQDLTFLAKFKQGQLLIVDRSPDLPPFFEGQTQLLFYLNMLSLDHFQVKQMNFEGFNLTVEMESVPDQSRPISHYLVNISAHSHISKEVTLTDLASWMAKRQQELHQDFAESMRKRGWRELATSKPLAGGSFDGLYLISIWKA